MPGPAAALLFPAAGGKLVDSVASDGSSVTFGLNSADGINDLRKYLMEARPLQHGLSTCADIVVDETYSFDNDAYTIASFKE
eukprot:scaffold255231_cov41-Prasinocladus_malaysianus.AAC.1